jgi:hypothetical protein
MRSVGIILNATNLPWTSLEQFMCIAKIKILGKGKKRKGQRVRNPGGKQLENR